MRRIREWSWRYVPAEICGTIGVISGASLAYFFTGNRIAAAYVGVIGENIGFYGVILWRDLRRRKLTHEKAGKGFGVREFLKTIQHLFLEFGPAEALDSLLVRPFCLYWFSAWLPIFGVGIIVGKFVADIIFYIPVVIAYEMKKKLL